MKINEISSNINQVGNLETSGSKQKDANTVDNQAVEKESQKGTKVDISEASVEFSKAAEKMDNVSKERADKVEHLKMMVQNDSYNVDSKKIAEKLMDEFI